MNDPIFQILIISGLILIILGSIGFLISEIMERRAEVRLFNLERRQKAFTKAFIEAKKRQFDPLYRSKNKDKNKDIDGKQS